MYGEYPAIVRAYGELFGDPVNAREALKRATFLVWRGAMELPVHTGIAPLPEGTVREVVDALDAHVRRGADDDELAWMLAWYHAQSPYLLELYGATNVLVQLAESRDAEEWRRAGITRERMVHRGQMGRYWIALAEGRA
jgi:hypothetical protein